MKPSRSICCVFLVLLAICSIVSLASGQARRSDGRDSMTDEELTEKAETEKLRAINKALRKPESSEKRVIGTVRDIDCKKGILFLVKTEDETFALAAKNFDSLILNAFVPMPGNSSIGCDVDVSRSSAVITYRENSPLNKNVRGDIAAIEFVPPGFRIMSQEEMNKSFAIDPSAPLFDAKEQEAIIRSIRQALYQPKEGETRKLGYLEKIECTDTGRYFSIRMVAKTYRLYDSSPATMPIRLFTRELEGMQFGCTMKPIDVPVVFIYRETGDPKSDGKIVSLEFVPRTFTLN